jgi:hypothetical protein
MRWRHPGLTWLAALLCASLPGTAPAQEDGRFEIRNAFVERAGGEWLLDVRLDLALAEAAQQSFDEGVPLMLVLEVEASVERRLLPDQTVVSFERRWQLAFDAIAQRYVVTDTAGGQETYGTQADALASFARLREIPVADESTLPPDSRFNMRVRASVEVGELPAAIKLLLFWKNWSRSTEWYAWSVRP